MPTHRAGLSKQKGSGGRVQAKHPTQPHPAPPHSKLHPHMPMPACTLPRTCDAAYNTSRNGTSSRGAYC